MGKALFPTSARAFIHPRNRNIQYTRSLCNVHQFAFPFVNCHDIPSLARRLVPRLPHISASYPFWTGIASAVPLRYFPCLASTVAPNPKTLCSVALARVARAALRPRPDVSLAADRSRRRLHQDGGRISTTGEERRLLRSLSGDPPESPAARNPPCTR